MSANAPSIGTRSSTPPLQESSSSSSSSKYDAVRMGLQECIARIKQVAAKISSQIPPKDNGGKFDCSVSLETMKDPTVLNCGHIFDRVSTEGVPQAPVNTCPSCRKSITTREPVVLIKNLINEWQQEERIPTFSHFKKEKENNKRAKQHLEIAKDCEEEKNYDKALDAYKEMFLYTKRSEDYAALPLLYKKLNQPEKATLAYLHLASYQLEEGKIEEAIKTLEEAEQMSPKPLKIDALLISLILPANPSREQIHEVLLIASHQEDPEEAISIYKQVIAKSPHELDAYTALCPLLKDPQEKRHFLLKAAHSAAQQGKPELAESFRKNAEIPLYPTSISQQDWANPAAFLDKLPPKPQALIDFLAAPCPIYGNEGKTAAETHIVVPRIKNITLIIDGAPVQVPGNLKNLDLLDKASGGKGCRLIWDEILKPEVDKAPEVAFEWVVMTRDVLPGSRNKAYDIQKALAEAKGYQVPGFLDAATAILWENQHSNTRLFNDNPWTYTRCHEKLQGYQLVVGGFAPAGLFVSNYYGDDERIGVAGLRKF